MPFLRLCRGLSPVGFADSPPRQRGLAAHYVESL